MYTAQTTNNSPTNFSGYKYQPCPTLFKLRTFLQRSMVFVLILISSRHIPTIQSIDTTLSSLKLFSNTPNIPSGQLQALKDIYDATNGSYWNWIDVGNAVPWDFSVPNPNPCIDNWEGITCNSQCAVTATKGAYCVVLELDLDKHNLTGTLPDSEACWSNLNTLTSLSLSSNPHLYGSIPSTLQALVNLTSLSLSNNLGWRGTSIPDSDKFFDAFPHLQLLDLSWTGLNGSFPQSMYSLSDLIYFDVGNNNFSGSLSTKLCSLVSIEILLTYANRFTGTIPNCLDQMVVLNTVDIGDNLMTGTLPSTLYSVSTLVTFGAYMNFFEGNLSTEIVQMNSLMNLELEGCLFTGNVPSLNTMTNLTVFAVSNNMFDGLLPINESKALTAFFITNNYFVGSLSQVNFTNLLGLSIVNNFITGSIPSNVTSNRVVFTTTFQERIVEMAPITFAAGIVVDIPFDIMSNITGNRFLYFDFSNNYCTGTLPNWLFTSPFLQYFYIESNYLTGTIPVEYNNSILHVLWLGDNQLTGSIPISMTSHPHFIDVKLSNNRFTGTIPADLFLNNVHLHNIMFDSNAFTGNLPSLPMDFVQSNLSALRQIIANDNGLTGTIPSEYFLFSQLNTFVLSKNCFSGKLPEETMCQSMNMLILILDGLSSAPCCQQKIFSGISNHITNSFRLKKTVHGTIPTCLFELPLIQDLYISGNALTGTISNNITFGPYLKQLRLSYNRLSGTIPQLIQERLWLTLDLSYNKFNGHLTNKILQNDKQLWNGNDSPDNQQEEDINQQEQALYLDVNRISGTIPSSIRSLDHISILNGNIFTCNVKQSDLPKHDPKSGSYDCGANSMYEVMLAWIVAVVILCLILIYLKWKMENVWKNVMQPIYERLTLWNATFYQASITGSTIILAKTNTKVSLSSFHLTWKFFHDFRRYSFYIACGAVVLMMPLYRIINIFQSMFENKYTWEFSAIYMAGYASGAMLMVTFTIVIAICFYLFAYKLGEDRVHEESKNLGKQQKSLTHHLRKWLLGFLVLITNILVVSTVSMGYVIVVVYVDKKGWIIVAQLMLAWFKVLWNEVSVWRLLHLWKYCINKIGGKEEDEPINQLYRQQCSSAEVGLIVSCSLFNNIVAPCLSVAIINPTCFYNAFAATQPVNAQYVYCSWYFKFAGITTKCLQFSRGETSFDPSFTYSYACASLFSVTYVSVFMYMALMSGVIIPLVKVMLKYLCDWLYDNIKERQDKGMGQPRMQSFLKLCFLFLRPMAPFSFKTCDIGPNIETSEIEPAVGGRSFPTLFKRDKVVVRLIGLLAILISFGVVFPPLGAVITISIIVVTYYEQLNIGRILYQSNELDYTWCKQQLEQDMEGISRAIKAAVFPMSIVASILFASLVFDTMGDRNGFEVALIAAIFTSLFPIFAAIALVYTTKWVSSKLEEQGVSIEFTSILNPLLKKENLNPLYTQQ